MEDTLLLLVSPRQMHNRSMHLRGITVRVVTSALYGTRFRNVIISEEGWHYIQTAMKPVDRDSFLASLPTRLDSREGKVIILGTYVTVL